MKRKRMSTMVFAMAFCSTIALAGAGGGASDGGNGGDAVVCRDADGSITSAELLDFYEGRVVHKKQIDLGDKSLDYREKISLALDRLAKQSPNRAGKFGNLAETFESEANYLSDVSLVDVPDSNHIALKRGCAIEQLVIMKEPKFAEDRRYTINKDIWDRLDNDNKAGMVLHELFYREALEHGHANSVGARYLNSLLCSSKFESMTQREFIDVLQRLMYPDLGWPRKDISVQVGRIEYNGNFTFYRPSFHEDGRIKRATAIAPAFVALGGRDGATIEFYNGYKVRKSTFELTLEVDKTSGLVNLIRKRDIFRARTKKLEIWDPGILALTASYEIAHVAATQSKVAHVKYKGVQIQLDFSERNNFADQPACKQTNDTPVASISKVFFDSEGRPSDYCGCVFCWGPKGLYRCTPFND